MISTEINLHTRLKSEMRGILGSLEVPSNPGVSSQWVVDQLREKAGLPAIPETREPDHLLDFLEKNLTQILVELGQESEAARLKAETDVGTRVNNLAWIMFGLFKK